MPAPNLIILDAAGATITEGTKQIITGQVPGTPTTPVTYQIKNDGLNDTATNVKLTDEGRLVAAGGDFLGQGVALVDEAAFEVRLLDAVGGNATTGWQPIGFQMFVAVPDIAGDAVEVFEARVNGNTKIAQTELILRVHRDSRSSPVGDHVGTGSGVYLGAGDGTTTDSFSRSGSALDASVPDHTVQLDDQAWLYRGEAYQILAADLHTTVEDGSGVAISPADVTQGYYIGLTLGDVVHLTDVWSVTAATAAVSADNTAGDATTKLTVGDYVHLAGEIHEVLSITDDNNFTLHTNHAAGATGEPVFKGWTVTKGDQVAFAARTDADKPTLPVGEVYAQATPAGQIFIWRPGDNVIPQAEIDDTASPGFYSRSAAGLDLTISRGRSKVHGYEANTSTDDTITLPTNQTNLVQINGPDDASIESTTDGTLNPGTMALYADVTDGAGVTASIDLRNFFGATPASELLFEVTTPGQSGAGGVITNPLNAPMFIRPGSIRFEIGLPDGFADPAALGWTSGSWKVDLVLTLGALKGSIYRSQGTDDRRPEVAFDATSPVSLAAPNELIKVPGGFSLAFGLVAIPGPPTGTDPSWGKISWAWSAAW